MTEQSTYFAHTSLANRLKRILTPLKDTPTGSTIYQHIATLLENLNLEARETHQAYTLLIEELLSLLNKRVAVDSPLHTHLKLLRLHLGTPLTNQDIMQLSKLLGALDDAQDESSQISVDEFSQALHSVSQGFAPASGPADSSGYGTELPKSPAAQPGMAYAPTSEPVDNKIGRSYRRNLDEKRERILQIQQTLGAQVNEVIKQNEEFGVLLEVEHETLQHTNSIEELQGLRSALVKEVEKLLKGNQSLATKLDKAKSYLKLVESEGQHLNDELTRVHILSLTDELTELPNRRAFLRRLEDEVARVQRYGSPLTMALIDMDTFKSINDKLGHAAGDEVLRNFSGNVLSIFRHHDMVARYGGEEFAILLPNTDLHNAERALQKVRMRTANTLYEFNDKTYPMPTFSAGLALYRPGETPSDLIERADKALYRAKDKGRNRIEIAPVEGHAYSA